MPGIFQQPGEAARQLSGPRVGPAKASVSAANCGSPTMAQMVMPHFWRGSPSRLLWSSVCRPSVPEMASIGPVAGKTNALPRLKTARKFRRCHSANGIKMPDISCSARRLRAITASTRGSENMAPAWKATPLPTLTVGPRSLLFSGAPLRRAENLPRTTESAYWISDLVH